MSSSLSEGKENVNVANEFARRDKATTSSSILKPSQKENLLQLTPNKPPKVSFKNTPISHHPACYRAELPQSVLDTWEEIRCLDEVENWTERTQIVTKEDHQLHIEFAIEFLEDILISLPDLKTPQNQIVKVKTEEYTEKSPSKAEKSIKSQSKCLSGPASSGSSDLKTVGCTMDGMDVDFAGPLDPAIASLNSLLKAGEDEEKAFSPIGSERTSPDCDTMVTSDDIEKLLAPHDMPDDGDIPSLKLFHGNRIDALMDSRFSATSLDEVTAKLDQLRIKFPSEKEIKNVEYESSLSVENTPTVLINEPQEEKGIKDEKDKIENALPIKRQSPEETAAAKKNVTDSSGEEKETFKKPLPPKPWKQKKKKVAQKQDPFDVVFVDSKAGGEASTKENSSASLNSMLADEKPQTSVTDSAVLPDGLSGSGMALNAVTVKPTLSRTDGDGEEKMKMNDDTFGVTQDDFGLGNDDFQSSGDAFSLQLDYLEKFGNTGNLDRLSALARQSLYVKFDPLVKGSSPDQGLRRMKADAANSKKAPANLEDLLLMNTPPDQQAYTSKLTAIKESDDKPTSSSLTGIDRLLTFSPEAQTSSVVAGQNSKPTQHKEDRSSTTADDLEESSLVQPLLYSKTDIEVAVKKEREALNKETHKESAFREMEIQEIHNKLQTQVETNEKLRRENDELRTVMNEYERTMAEMIETSEKNKNVSDESNNEITKERDQLQADLNSVEAAFSDLHRRYEKLKGVLENFKKNEEILKKATIDYQEKLRKSGEKYQMLKKHAEEKIETANIEINRVRRSNDSEMAVMRAALKKEQNKSVSLEQAVQQKINENIELTAICDELIQRASGAK